MSRTSLRNPIRSWTLLKRKVKPSPIGPRTLIFVYFYIRIMSVAVLPPMLKGSRLHVCQTLSVEAVWQSTDICCLQDAFPSRAATLQLSDIDSAFPLQEYIAHLVQLDPHNVESIVSIPGSRSIAEGERAGLGLGVEDKDAGVDEACWIYEQLRYAPNRDTDPPPFSFPRVPCDTATRLTRS